MSFLRRSSSAAGSPLTTAKMSDFFESVGSFFSGRVQRQLPSTTVEFTRFGHCFHSADRVIEIGLTATAFGLIVGGIAVALVRRNY
ncbi:hypothetical protein L1887_12565 [Cichorium endivia]|nr:hypothetical protein L1887_12565 [Cichorium endivia]